MHKKTKSVAQVKKEKETIENAIKNATPSANAVKLAIERRDKQREEAEAEKIILALDKAENKISSYVNELRVIRDNEKQTKKKILKVSQVIEEFKENADLVAFSKKMKEFGVYDI